MKMKLFTSIVSLIIVGTIVLIYNPANAAPGERGKDGFNKAKMVEHRIDRLTMILCDKEEEGIDITDAEDILLEAIDLFEAKKYDDALFKLDEVEKCLGIERRQQSIQFGKGRPGDGMFNREGEQDRRHFMKREFSDEEKESIMGEIKDGISKAQRLIEEGNLEKAFRALSDAQRKLGEVAGIPPPPFMQGNRGMRGPDNRGGQFRPSGPDQRKNAFRGKDGKGRAPGFDPEVREKLQKAMKALKDAAGKYLEKNEKDEFIETCFNEVKEMEKKLRRGEIDPDGAIEIIKSIEEKILDKI